MFTHHNDSSVDSVFEGHIRVINLDSFSDSDNLSDAFDHDSDDDGCFDVIEAGYEDMDNDGLAGVSPIFYNPSSATSSADERGRVVYSGYDYTQA